MTNDPIVLDVGVVHIVAPRPLDALLRVVSILRVVQLVVAGDAAVTLTHPPKATSTTMRCPAPTGR